MANNQKLMLNTHRNNLNNLTDFKTNLVGYEFSPQYDHSTTLLPKKYFSLNTSILYVLSILKMLDLTTTQVALASGNAVEANMFVVPLLNNILLLYIISFMPIISLMMINYLVFKDGNLQVLKVIMITCMIFSFSLFYVVGNNFMVIYLAYNL